MAKDYTGTKGLLIARVSEEGQRKALPAQKRNLDEYARRLGLVIDPKNGYREFDETAYKGDEREKFHKLTEEVCGYTEFCVVVFDKVDRFARDYTDVAVRSFRELALKGKIELHFASEGLILHKDSPATEWTRLGLGMVLSENYSRCISYNVKRRQKDKIAHGEYPGKVPIGYLNITTGLDKRGDKITDVIVDENRVPYIKKAYELRAEGYSVKAIAKILRDEGLVNPKTGRPLPTSSIDVMLKNGFYVGRAKWGDVEYQHMYPPIIDSGLFEIVQRVNKDREKNGFGMARTGEKEVYAHSKVVRCGVCGGIMSPYTKKGHVYLRCSKRKYECGNCGVSEVEVDKAIMDVLKRLKITEDDVNRILGTLKSKHDNEQAYYTNQVKQARDEYRKLERKKEVAYDDRLNGSITLTQYEKIAEKCDDRMAELDETVARLEGEDGSFLVDAPYLLELAKRAPELYESSRSGLKNKMLRTIFSNLSVAQKTVLPSLLEPFTVLSQSRKMQFWLPGLDSNQ